jgi:branched-chain amino acid transport system ATP-binding protein
MSNPLLSIHDLRVCYGVITALHGVSLEIAPGEIVTLIGANGAGKTTLLRTISGLLRPQNGSIFWNPTTENSPEPANEPHDIGRLPAHRIVRMGICHVPEGRQIFADLTVRDNLLLGAYSLKTGGRKALIAQGLERAYSLFPILAERRGQKSGTLSGGEQQMLAIARALMARPTLLLLDEPSLGLAPLIVRKIFDIIREINADGCTVFLVEQNAHMALAIAHRAYVMQTGQIIKSDLARNLLNDPQVKEAYLGG